MARIIFHVEVEDCLYEEMETPPAEETLENQAIADVAALFGAPVKTHGRRYGDGSLICSFKGESLEKVRKTIDKNRLVEGNDQIAHNADYVIVRDFEDEYGEPVWNEGGA